MTNPSDDLHRLVEAVKVAGADIAPSYREYVQLAFAIASDCGEAGRADFHTLCSFSSKYDARHADKLFTNALRTGYNNVHLGTAFHLADRGGVQLAPPRPNPVSASEKKKAEELPSAPVEGEKGTGEEELRHDSDPYVPLPVFPQDYKWPSFLQRILSYGNNPWQHDALLLGSFTVLGSTLSQSVRCLYSRKWQQPCLQTFVTAPSASGKRVLSWVRLLAEPVHDAIRAHVAEAMKQYRSEKMEYDALGKGRKNCEPPVIPPNRMFLIPGNNSATGILQNLMDSDGIGLICESEADTVSTALGTDYGHWSDTLRKAFDHDAIAYNRRMDREYRELKHTYLSVLLSGTPMQVKPFIPSAENGLFSRNIFYYMPRVDKWVDQFTDDGTDVESEFRRMGKEWKAYLDELKLRGIYTLQLDETQKETFNRLFADLFQRAHIANGSEMNSSVVRLAVNTCRILSIVALLRQRDSPSLASPDASTVPDNLKDGIISRWDLFITDADFHAVLALVEPLYCHATHVLSFLESTEVRSRSTADRDRLFAAMPQEFLRRDLVQQAEEMGIPPNTAITWLKRLRNAGSIVFGENKGSYRKKN
ncbi:YfjI family protein [Parabacteroides goldsteinii]|jgi:hypothetical protein|uniref:YfjI family protein n=1 Tax=Parabacteroides goldsteinii TaxID=328812 RepID=UPI001D767774|nr:YfjI family protein [Parabacteroides goldsteinii]MBS6577143.1 DUF3987 domain-containing protein [Parabacteroides goldsteinii]